MPAHDPVVNPSVHYLGVYGTTTLADHAQCVAQNDRIKAERADEYGPNGAYNHQMCNSHGVRFDGRGWFQDGAANGGENGIWYNAGSRSLCVLVGTDDVITDVCVAGIRAWANEAVDVHGMQWPLRGHSEFVATSCPGDNLRAVVAAINANHGGIPVPPPIPKDGDDMQILVGQITKPGQTWNSSVGPIPIPANTPAAFLMQGGIIVGSWAEPGAPFGVPSGAAAWKAASGSRASVEVIALDKDQMGHVLFAHNKQTA